MTTPSFSHALGIGYKLGWPAELNDANHMTVLAKLRDALLAGGLRDDVPADTQELAGAQADRLKRENCEGESMARDHFADRNHVTSQAASRTEYFIDSPCHVQIHFLYQVLRGFPPEQVFAQTLLGFELASANPDVVGINFVPPEHRRGPQSNNPTQPQKLD